MRPAPFAPRESQLMAMKVKELKTIAKRLNVRGRSNMNKEELVQAIIYYEEQGVQGQIESVVSQAEQSAIDTATQRQQLLSQIEASIMS